MMRIVATFVFVLIAGTLSLTIAQDHIPTQEELLQSVPGLRNISGLANFNISSIKTEDVEKLFRDKCERNGGPAAYSTAKDSITIFSQCIQSLVNVTELQAEMEAAKPHGELETVFQKYCRRVPNLKRCVRNITDSIEPCLASEERENTKNIHNITHSLLEFICHDDGDRIAMFIAAGGVECFKSKQQDVMKCANQTFHSYIPTKKPGSVAGLGITSIPTLVLGLEQCTDIENFRTCTVKVLEDCDDPTPANVVESLFNYVKRATPCDNLLTAQASAVTGNITGNSGFSHTISVPVLLMTIAMLLSVKFV